MSDVVGKRLLSVAQSYLQPLHGVWSSQYKPCLTVGLTRYYVAVSGLVFVDLRIM